MDNDLKQRWIKALESGKYKKGINRLKWEVESELKYCCLGVLCDLLDSEGWDILDDYESYRIYTHKYGDSIELNQEILDQIGLSRFGHDSLIELNDKHNTWGPVIEYIEKIGD